jgi:GTP pyrophosphokinase
VVDFAYAIHSDVGDHGGRQGQWRAGAAAHELLQNGDVVEIITDPTQRPTRPGWASCAPAGALQDPPPPEDDGT